MKFEIAPVVDATELLEAVQKETNLFDDIDYLANFLWEGEYTNDSYKKLWLDESVGEDLWTQRMNFLVIFIKERIPTNCGYILVDVSW